MWPPWPAKQQKWPPRLAAPDLDCPPKIVNGKLISLVLQQVVRNHERGGEWGSVEERDGGFPFQLAQQFDVIIESQPDVFCVRKAKTRFNSSVASSSVPLDRFTLTERSSANTVIDCRWLTFKLS